MIGGSASTALPPNINTSPKSKLKTLAYLLILVLLIGVVAFLLIWQFGSQQIYENNRHPLYDSFDASGPHSKLLSKLEKGKHIILVGKREDGLFQFVEHFANRLSLGGKPVFLESFNPDHFQMFQIVREAKVQIKQLLNLQQGVEADWILQSGQQIPIETLAKIQSNYPQARIVIATTTKQKIKGFKELQFVPIKAQLIKKSISKNFNVSINIAHALYDYFETPEKAFNNLEIKSVDRGLLIGDNYKPIEGLDKRQNKILKQLCSKGNAKSKEQSTKLNEMGIIHHQGNIYWAHPQARLNYQLNKYINCEEGVDTQLILKSIQQDREKIEREQKQKEEKEKKIKEEAEKKAKQQQERKQKEEEQLKIKQQQQRQKLEESKLQQSTARLQNSKNKQNKNSKKSKGKNNKQSQQKKQQPKSSVGLKQNVKIETSSKVQGKQPAKDSKVANGKQNIAKDKAKPKQAKGSEPKIQVPVKQGKNDKKSVKAQKVLPK